MKPPSQLESSWQEILKDEWNKPYLEELAHFLSKERRQFEVYPPKGEVFQAFEKTPFTQVKVVIVGQDPYHGPGQAHGLSFSVKQGVKLPPSLKNIYKEIHDDLGLHPPLHGYLGSWAEQGILMLNAVLTVRAHEPQSHHGKGWEMFTDCVISHLAHRESPPIFVLWGNQAKAKCKIILEKSQKKHFILESAHPSPYSAHFGFLGCKHFSKVNEYLKTLGHSPINWVMA